MKLKYNQKVLVSDKYYFELKIDYDKKSIFINIYDIKGIFIEKRCFISFKRLEERINIKLKKLALIRASKKKIGNDLYFRYYKISCYFFKSFENFIKMIEEDIIKLTIMLRFSKSNLDFGKQKNKNMVFLISQNNIDKISDKIYEYEN